MMPRTAKERMLKQMNKKETIPEYFERLVDNYRDMKVINKEEADNWFIDSLWYFVKYIRRVDMLDK